MITKKIYFVIIVLSLIGISCSSSNNPVGINEYKPGEVVVVFQDSVNYIFISDFINNLKLTPITISADSSFSMWIQVDSGQINNQLALLQQDTNVVWANQRGYPFDGDPKKEYILTHFRGTIKINYALTLIKSIGGLSWVKTLLPWRNAVIGVPIGKEQYWINAFEKYSYIKYAELNYILHAD